MEIIGHRGCSAQYPENTVHAVREAARRLGAVEIDVRRCRTGELIAFHDERVDRVTDTEGAVADLGWERLRELPVDGSDHQIPRLSDVLTAVPAGATAQIELKETGIAADALAAAEAAAVNVRVTSFVPKTLAAVRRIDPDVPTGYLFDDDDGVTVDATLEVATDLGCDSLHPHYERCAETDVVERGHAVGLSVIAWDGSVSEAAVEATREAGADGMGSPLTAGTSTAPPRTSRSRCPPNRVTTKAVTAFVAGTDRPAHYVNPLDAQNDWTAASRA